MPPGVTGIGVENDGVGVERVGGPEVGGLVDCEMSSRCFEAVDRGCLLSSVEEGHKSIVTS